MPRVMMIRRDLASLPHIPVPDPFRIRWHTDGDDERWMAIKSASDLHHDAPAGFFEHTYGADRDLLAQRQVFLLDATGRPVGTVTAWFEEIDGTRHGKVNWMLLVPAAQGLGLSKALLAICLSRLAELGHTDAVLYTLTARMPAINLYRGFGFVPLIRDQTDVTAWDSARPQMKSPFTNADYANLA